MFAVVEDDQRIDARQVLDDLTVGGIAADLEVEHACDGRHHVLLAGDGRQVDEPDTPGLVVQQFLTDFESETSLPRPACRRQRDEPRHRERLAYRRQLAVAADQPPRRDGQVRSMGTRDPQGREIPFPDLMNLHRIRDIA